MKTFLMLEDEDSLAKVGNEALLRMLSGEVVVVVGSFFVSLMMTPYIGFFVRE
jgi:hypothetical protein